jgi:hypothetical protein
MDALALLCTLHADGPTTLKRLRQSDCHSLEVVIALDVAQLAQRMRTSELVAERFRREAQSLQQRIHGPDPGVESGTSGAPRSARSVRETARAEFERAAPEQENRVADDVLKRRALDRVLSTWRERDDLNSTDDIDELAAALPREHGSCEEDAEPTTARAVSSASAPRAIEVGAIDGLDAAASRAFADAGVCTLRDLGSCDALAIARESGLSYSRVVRLRALARREIARSIAPTPAATALTLAMPASVASPRASAAEPEPSRARPGSTAAISALPKVSWSERPAATLEPLGHFDGDFVLRPGTPDEGAGGPFA